MRALRSGIRRFDEPGASELILQAEIPLLKVRVRNIREVDGLDREGRRPLRRKSAQRRVLRREHDGTIHRDGRRDRSARCDCGRNQSGHVGDVLGEDRGLIVLVPQPIEDAVAGAHHKALRRRIGETDARREVFVIALDDRAGVAVLSRQNEHLERKTVLAAEVVRVHGLCVEVVPHAEIQREPARDLPIVLHECAGIERTLVSPGEHGGGRVLERFIPHQKIGPGVARSGNARVGAENRAEDICSESADQVIELVPPDIRASLDGVIAVNDGEVVHPLKNALDIEVGRTASEAGKAGLAADLSGGAEGHAGESLHGGREEAEADLLAEGRAGAPVADGAAV